MSPLAPSLLRHSLQQLASRPVKPRLKKRHSWRSFCSTQENQALREKLILCPSTRPWNLPKLHRDHVHRRLLPLRPRLIQYCSRLLRILPTTDVVLWTDGSVPSSLGAGGAGIHARLILLLTVLLSWPCLL